MRLSIKQAIFLCLALLVVSVGVIGGVYYFNNRAETNEKQTGPPAPADPLPQANQQAQQTPQSIRLLATGDMIAHDSINANAKQSDGSYDYDALMSGMGAYFEKGDINFCNQSTPAGGEEFGISGYPIFNAPIAFARGIEDIGCNVINIGTNHTNDKGQKLVDATVAAWDERDVLAVAGANRSKNEQNELRTFEVNGVQFAFVAYTDYSNSDLPNTYGVNKYSDALAKSQIAAAHEQADFVIVSMRWGTEYADKINTRQNQVAQKLADYGADVVFGHGPHVLQPVKIIKSSDGREVPVWFSLGNFLNSQLEAETRVGGFASMNINPSTLKISDIGFMPVYQHYEWTPEEKAAGNLLARKNFKMAPLADSAELLKQSLLNTTVDAQLKRVSEVLNRHSEVTILDPESF